MEVGARGGWSASWGMVEKERVGGVEVVWLAGERRRKEGVELDESGTFFVEERMLVGRIERDSCREIMALCEGRSGGEVDVIEDWKECMSVCTECL